MIYYREGSAGGEFNQYVVNKEFESVSEYIIAETPAHREEWGLPPTAELASIRLDRSRRLTVSGDTLFFCCAFDCGFLSSPGQDIEDADVISLDVAGTALFHPLGTKKVDFLCTDVHMHRDRAGENCTPSFPGVSVSQKLHPAFGYNEEQRNKVLETEANRFLTQYWPEALHTVSSVPLRQIAEEKMGLQVYTGYKLQENQTALGLTVFRTQRLAVEDEETGEMVMRRFPRGSIIIDSDTMWNRGLGSFNFTLAHEMYHWFAHRVHIAFMDIIGKPDDYERIQGHLESQANGVGARILMPGFAVTEKYKEAMAGSEDADTYEMAVSECARFFGASKTAMKKRLHELGLHEKTRRPTVRRRLDVVEMFAQYAADKTFRDLLDSGLYRYLRGFVIRNDPKYISEDGLTEYARQHPDECILTFREAYETQVEGDGHLLYRKDDYFSRRADYDARMAEDPALMQQMAEKLSSMREKYLSALGDEETFCQFITPIITQINTKYMGLYIRDEMDDGFDAGQFIVDPGKRYRSRYFETYDFQTGKKIKITEPEVFQNKTPIGYKMFERMRRDDWNDLELDMAIAVCAGYHLDMDTTENALLHAGYILLRHNPRHLVFRFLISHCREMYEDTGTFNTLLILLGEEEVGTKKKLPKK